MSGANTLVENSSERSEDRIPDLVSEFVVDRLQIIDIYHHDRARGFPFGGAIEFAL